MKILITNDDGIRAQGINSLYKALSEKWDVVMVAPHQERSSCGHGITLGQPVRITKISESIYDCTGMPADCILIGLGHIMKDSKPDLVISGINHGANLGQDRFYSGTMAAAREATFKGIPSIAISLVTGHRDEYEHFESACQVIVDLLERNIQEYIPHMGMLNINVPNLAMEDIAGYKDSFAGFQVYSEKVIERVDARGKDYFWIGGIHSGHQDIPGSDCNWVNQGHVSLDLHDVSGKCSKYEQNLNEVIKKL